MQTLLQKFKAEAGSLKDYIALVNVKATAYQKTNIEILKYLITAQKTPGVYITINKPHEIINRALEKAGIDTRLIIYIDGISKVNSSGAKKIGNCLFIGNPERLSDISVAADQAIKALPEGDKFLYLDSVSTMMIYNQIGTVARFAHFLTSKIREWGIKGIIISINQTEAQTLIDELTQFCDFRIDV